MNQLPMVITPDVSDSHLPIHIVTNHLEGESLSDPAADGNLVKFAEVTDNL